MTRPTGMHTMKNYKGETVTVLPEFLVTIEQHRKDYQGTLANPVAYRGFHYLHFAKEWAYYWFQQHDTAYRYAVIEGKDGTFLTSPTDGPIDKEDWE